VFVLIIPTLWFSFLTLYASKDIEIGISETEYLAGLGDFIGGMMNPVLTFVTIYLLINTIRQNQEIIEISSEELKASTAQLKGTREALEYDSRVNTLKYHHEIINFITNDFLKLIRKNDLNDQTGAKVNIEQIVESFTKTEQLKYTNNRAIDQIFENTLKNSLSTDNFNNILSLSSIFSSSLTEVLSKSKQMRGLYQNHVIPRTIEVLVLYGKDERYRDGHRYDLIFRECQKLNELGFIENFQLD